MVVANPIDKPMMLVASDALFFRSTRKWLFNFLNMVFIFCFLSLRQHPVADVSAQKAKVFQPSFRLRFLSALPRRTG